MRTPWHRARDAGIEAVSWADLALSDAQRRTGKLPSHWVVLSADQALTELLKASGGWKPVEPRSGSPVGTDRFSNLLGVFPLFKIRRGLRMYGQHFRYRDVVRHSASFL